jgi:hypothetical protein
MLLKEEMEEINMQIYIRDIIHHLTSTSTTTTSTVVGHL